MEQAEAATRQDHGIVSKLQIALRDFQERLHDGLFILTRQESASAEGYARDVSEASNEFQKLVKDLPQEFYETPAQLFERRIQAETEALQSLEPERRRAVSYWKVRSESLQRIIDGPFAQRCLDSAGSGHELVAEAHIGAEADALQPADEPPTASACHPGRSSSASAPAPAEECGSPGLPRPILKDLWQDKSRRFIEELEFVQLLADPNYVHFLALRGYLEDESFIEFLRYLQYWREPPYVQHVVYPQALRMLDMLLTPEVRKRMHRPATLALLSGSMMWKWANMPEASSKLRHRELESQSAGESAVESVVRIGKSASTGRREVGGKRPTLRGLPLLCRMESDEALQRAWEDAHEQHATWRSTTETLGFSGLKRMRRKHDRNMDDVEDKAKHFKLSASSGGPVDFLASTKPSGVSTAADAAAGLWRWERFARYRADSVD